MDWIESISDNWWLVWLAFGLSLGSLVMLPFIILALPANYFVDERRRSMLGENWPPMVRPVLLVLKNLVGVIMLVLGVLMLVLPGQGVLTVLTALVLIDFPGKFRCERWLASRGKVLKALNWLRNKRGVPPLQSPGTKG